MTVSYSQDLVSVQWWSFARILFRWRGSIYKLILPDLITFLLIFTLFSLVYRFAMPLEMRNVFEQFCVYCSQFENLIPVVFILGFFVQLIVSRWSEQSQSLPYPDNLAFLLHTYVRGDSKEEAVTEAVPGSSRAAKCHVDGPVMGKAERARLIRRTVMRYANLSIAAAFRRVSYPVKKKIPTEEEFVSLQLMTKEELAAWESFPVENKYFLPLSWSADLISRARKEGLIEADLHEKIVQEAIDALRGKIGMLFFYDFISPPLAYTQATTICVYSFFLSTLFGRQFLVPASKFAHVMVDAYVPVFTIFQFVFYVGWLKVAEELINPYGKDDEDLDILVFIKRNLEVTGLMVDVKSPSLRPEDLRWDAVDSPLVPGDWTPGLTVSGKSKTQFSGSVTDVQVPMARKRPNRPLSSLSPPQDVERGVLTMELVNMDERPRNDPEPQGTREQQAPLLSTETPDLLGGSTDD